MPRVKKTTLVRLVLWLLPIYVITLLALIAIKFVMTVQSSSPTP